MNPDINFEPLNDSQLHRLLATTPTSRKLGFINDNGVLYMTVFKTENSKRPMTLVPAMDVIAALNICFEAGMLGDDAGQ